MRRSSLFRIALFIISATVTLVVAIIAVLFSIYGQDFYVNYKTDELMPKAKSISNQLTKLYGENADWHTVDRMLYSDEFSVPDAKTYVMNPNGAIITNEEHGEEIERSKNAVSRCFESALHGESVSIPRSAAGILVGVPVYGDAGNVIGAVVLVHNNSVIREKVNSLAMNFGLIMIAVLLLALIPSVFVFRSVTRPIKSITNTALDMARGDLDVRADVRGSFEAQHLAEAFNTLAGALQSNVEHLVIERNRLGAVLNGIEEGIIAVDRRGAITHFNSASVKLLGGADGSDPSVLPLYNELRAPISLTLDNDAPEHIMLNCSGRLLRVIMTPIHEDNGALFGAVAMISDVTESERLEQTRRDYVANVSHELRTPLASIRSLADALCDELITEQEDRKRYYGYIQRESIRLSHLIDDLLELSRLQSGGVAFVKGKVDLYEIAFDVADRMNEQAQQRGKTVVLAVKEGEYYANTNSDRVEQVLVALTDNAIKHGLDGCTVTIELFLSEDEQSYLFSVSNPASIDPSDLEHIFERFYKADHAHSGEGTGLGLAIVSEVMNLLGERVFVDYDGSTICFTFTSQRDKRDSEHAELPRKSPNGVPAVK